MSNQTALNSTQNYVSFSPYRYYVIPDDIVINTNFFSTGLVGLAPIDLPCRGIEVVGTRLQCTEAGLYAINCTVLIANNPLTQTSNGCGLYGDFVQASNPDVSVRISETLTNIYPVDILTLNFKFNALNSSVCLNMDVGDYINFIVYVSHAAIIYVIDPDNGAEFTQILVQKIG